MIVYAESSAVLAWLLEEDGADPVTPVLKAAELVVTSDLTLVEVERTLVRAATTGRLTPAHVALAAARLHAAARYWLLVRLSGSILARAREPFPVEPVRTLDALHLASVLETREAVRGLAVLSLDERIRGNAAALAIPVLP